MTDNQLTASRLELAATCPGAFAHEHVQTTNEAAERGTQIHTYIAALLEGDRPVSPQDEQAAAICATLDAYELSKIARPTLGAEFHTEQALYLVPVTGECGVLGGAYHRDYSGAPEGALVGTADAVAVGDETVTVSDWKTGKSEVSHPAQNYQLRFLGLAAARSYGKNRATVHIGVIGSDGAVELRSATLEAEDLASMEQELARIDSRVRAAREGNPVYQSGSHCRYCPALPRCPAISDAAQAIMDGPPEEMTPKRAAELWSQLQGVEAAAKRTREALQGFVYARPVPTTGGRQLKVVETRRENIDSPKAFAILRQHLPDETLAEVVSVTKTSLSSGLGKDAQKDAMDAFRQADAVSESYSESLREVRG